MNTGETIHTNGDLTDEPIIWCDLCGWGDTIGNDGGLPDDPHHFCHRHKADEIRDYIQGRECGYFDGQQELDW